MSFLASILRIPPPMTRRLRRRKAGPALEWGRAGPAPDGSNT